MTNVVLFPGGKRCLVCKDQIHPQRVRDNPDVVTCNAKCQVTKDVAASAAYLAAANDAAKRDNLTL